ncbi:DNA alkylation repair protein [candidate division KSB1 bacterium]
MNIDLKIDAENISKEIVDGTIEQACFDYENILGNYHFLTSSNIEKSFLNNLGNNLAKHTRKNPRNYLAFCTKIWHNNIKDGRTPLGNILAVLESIDPDTVIPEILNMCRSAKNADDVDTLVNGFEPVILRDPEKYLPLLHKEIRSDSTWVQRLVIVTIGHIMYRYKTEVITSQCLEVMRPVIINGNKKVSKATSWIIGSYGVRADQRAVAEFMSSFAGSDNENVVWTFAEAFKRSKIALQADIIEGLIPIFEEWSNSDHPKIKKCAKSALKILVK